MDQDQNILTAFKGRQGLCAALLVAAVVLAAFSQGIAASKADGEPVRRSILAGTWYPADPKELRTILGDFLQRAALPDSLPSAESLIGIVSPHAGIRYSGAVAAYAYKVVQSSAFDTVVVLAPSHRVAFSGVSVHRRGPFETPLGRVPLDPELIEALMQADPDVRDLPEAHAQEHSLEIQLPFLQVVLPSFRLVPLVMGRLSWDTCERLAQALSALSRSRRFLVVASTDLSHYHSEKDAQTLDQRLLERLRRLEARELMDELASGNCEACGAAPLVTLMLYARAVGAHDMRILKYGTSADVTGETNRVVGYAAAAVFKHSGARTEGSEAVFAAVPSSPSLSAEDKARLKNIARQTLAAKLFGTVPSPDLTLSELPPPLREPRGAFVTLKRHGQLRGCIGQIEARQPLAHTVSRMAVAAAFQDPRFPPVTPDEWDDLELEISVLSPLTKLDDPTQVRVGTHGLVLRKGSRSGLLLPQVAVEQGWDRETFLRQTCRKAGLPPEAWRDSDTEIFTFTADVF
jgi:AmmeMemoRadiSam system protein B/AmmeMemoRadiSam system protein A